MSDPKSALSLKRKRLADPVDTLYFESSSANPATRRFTDFVYKRVKDPDGLIATPEPADENSRSQLRAVSAAAAVRSQPSNAYDNGIPHVKSSLAEDFPGLLHHPSLPSLAARKPNLSTSSLPLSRLSGYQHGRSTSSLTPDAAAAATPPSLLNLRKFHLSTASIRRNASSTSLHSAQISASSSRASLLDRSKFAITKHRAKDIEKGISRTASAVVVEHFDRPASSRAASTVGSQRQKTTLLPPTTDGPSKPRRRPLINEAEKKFRLQQQEILKARTLQNQFASVPDTKQTQRYDEQDQLAAELEQMALEMTSYAQAQHAYLPMPVPAAKSNPPSPTPDTTAKPKLKYQPKPTPRRQPKVSIDHAGHPTMEDALASGVFHVAATGQQVPGTVPRLKGKSLMQLSTPATTTTLTTTAAAATPLLQPAAGEEESPMSIDRFPNESDSESDSEYVYDVFIRQPVEDYERELRNAQLLRDGDSAAAVPRDIGVVVITDEDAPYWEEFFEDGSGEEGKEWNSEDEDSNAEDYYANEYPEEEDSEDEEREKGGLWYDDDDDDDDDDKYDSDNIYSGYRTGIRDFSDDDDDYY
ncbi:Glucose-repressible alcohol dehydrogenase transcriptional effector [Ascosphaera pollenicola]|nr:Glucose-repressible alcohol dehydrogenase transcriptional effector [Ascosphaera pollenicola]